MRLTNRILLNNMILDLQRNTERLDVARRRVATGKYMQHPSDDPVRMAKALSLRETLVSLQQYDKNADEAKGWIDNTFASLNDVREVITNTRVEVLRAANDTQTPDARAASADVVRSLKTHLLAIANTKINGDYIFGGEKITTQPYVSNGVYQGDAGKIRREISSNEYVTVNLTGDEVFNNGVDVFDMLDQIETAMRNNDSVTLNGLIDDVDQALDNILSLQASSGTESQRLDAAKERLADNKVTYLDLQAQVEDVDAVEAITELQSMQTLYQASLTAGSMVFQQNLLDFLR